MSHIDIWSLGMAVGGMRRRDGNAPFNPEKRRKEEGRAPRHWLHSVIIYEGRTIPIHRPYRVGGGGVAT